MASHIVGKIDLSTYDFRAEIDALNSIPKQQEEYDEFGYGYWKNLSLYNSSGIAEDSQYKNSIQCVATSYMDQCPRIKELLEKCFSFDNLRMVRARNLIDGAVLPHRDYVELDKKYQYFRFFLPLEENRESFHSDESGVFQMRPGEVWFLDAGTDHAAVNFSVDSRMSLCLDYVFDRDFDEREVFSDSCEFDEDAIPLFIDRTKVPEEEKQSVIQSTAKLLTKHSYKDLLFALAKLHFSRDMEVAECYDWMMQACTLAGNQELADKTASIKRYIVEHRELNERMSINSWDV